MTDDDSQLPVFPTDAPAIFSDPDATRSLFAEVFERLVVVVELDADQLAASTPCAHLDAAGLRTHVLGWLDFFAIALSDPGAATPRPQPDAFELHPDQLPSEVVRRSAATIDAAIESGVASELVVMSSSRMAGDGVLAMALGEYVIHGWDLARTVGRDYEISDAVIRPAHEFLRGMIAPEYRGPDSGFFDAEVEVPGDAPALDQLLGFAGRDPQWQRPSG